MSEAQSLADAVVAGDRAALARAITLVESEREDHRADAQELLAVLLDRTGGARRIGVSGPPGVGKSTFLDVFGMFLVARGLKVAVLAVDPSSRVTGGSILGDKARMDRLAQEPNAFIRPSPSGATLGGVARRTREAMLLCEAAGFDVVLVETVGVGQSETVVADMVDCFVVLMQPGSGDELQGIKKGVLEHADLLVVNKADGENLPQARTAVRDLSAALRYLRAPTAHWRPQVLAVSSRESLGLEELWNAVEEHHAAVDAAGVLAERRAAQRVRWMWALVEERLQNHFRSSDAVRACLTDVEAAVMSGGLPPGKGAELLLRAFREESRE